MALSYVQYYGNGSNRNFSLTFSYLSRDNVSVSVDGVASAFSWLNSTTIQLPTAPANGAVVEVRRTTNRTERVVDFTDGSTIHESDLDNALLQSFYLAQEAFDAAGGTLSILPDGSFGASNRRISLVADPVNPQDAVTKGWVEAVGTGIIAQAAAARDAAEAAKSTATAQAGSAVTARQGAEGAEAGAKGARDATLQARDETTTLRDATQALRNETATLKGDVVAIQGDVTDKSTQATTAAGTAVSARDQAQAFRNEAKVFRDEAAGFSGGTPPATGVTFIGSGNLSANNVQAALEELDAEKAPAVHNHDDRYYTETEVDALLVGKAAASHTHTIADLPMATSGESANNKLVRADDIRLSNNRAPTSHSHSITDLPVAPSGTSSTTQLVRADDSRLSNARAPTTHSHAISDVTNLQTSLNGKLNTTGGTLNGGLTITGALVASNGWFTVDAGRVELLHSSNPSIDIKTDANADYHYRLGITGPSFEMRALLGNARYAMDQASTVSQHFGTGNWHLDYQADNNVVLYDGTGAARWTILGGTISMRSMKDNVEQIRNPLWIVESLSGYTFNMKDSPDRRELGVIAEEIENVLPEAMRYISAPNSDEVFKLVEYDRLTALLIEAVKELSFKVRALEER